MRRKVTYPLNQTITGLFTPGKEYRLVSTGEEYIGSYHKFVDGLVMTGPVPKSISEELRSYDVTISAEVMKYNELKNIVTESPFEYPITKRPIPVVNDYHTGYMIRYVLYQRNLPSRIYEIDKDQYDRWLKDGSGIDQRLYDVLEFRWKLTGPIRDSYVNGVLQSGVVDTNKRTLITLSSTIPDIQDFFFDLKEFSIWSNLTSTSIKSKFL